MKKLLIGTRRSLLARAQAQIIADAISSQFKDISVELVLIVTTGDKTAGPLQIVGGKGLFTAELEEALRKGEIDIAVHSAKDLPAVMAEDFAIAAVPKRQDPRDALICPAGGIEDLPTAALVGTSSLRRSAQLKMLRADLKIEPIRGNIDTRINKVLEDKSQFDATILAMAGLIRSGLDREYESNIFPLGEEVFIPAAGQGTLVVQALADNKHLIDKLGFLDDGKSREALLAERKVLQQLGASCRSCIAVFINEENSTWRSRAMIARPDGSGMISFDVSGANCQEVTDKLLKNLNDADAASLLCGE